MENNKKESKFFKMAEEFENIYGVGGGQKKLKNIRKHKVDSVQEIIDNLEPGLKEEFEDICKKMDKPFIIRYYWNKLVEYGKLAKEDLADNLLMAGGSSMIASSLFMFNGNFDAAAVLNFVATGMFAGSIAADYLSNKGTKTQMQLERMRILVPELYDVELVFNGYRRQDIDTSEYDGKARYQKLNALLNEELKKTKLQHDLESDEDKAM